MSAGEPMRPVFIGGCSRSGTTLLGALLGAHSRCVCVPEAPFKFRHLRDLAWGPDGVPLWRIAARLEDSYKFKLWGLEASALLDGAGPETRMGYAEAITHVVRTYARAAGRDGADVWADHTPGNVRNVTRLLEAFPRARFVHIVRDGRGVTASLLPLSWGRHSVIGAAHFWVRQLGYGLAAETWDARRVTRVRFEDLLRRPRRTMEALCGDLELDAEPRLGAVTRYTLPRATRRQHTLVERPPQPERAAAWKTSLSPRQVEVFESIAGEPLRCLGYELEYGGSARDPTLLERALDTAREPLGKLGNVPSHVRNFLFRRFGLGRLDADPAVRPPRGASESVGGRDGGSPGADPPGNGGRGAGRAGRAGR